MGLDVFGNFSNHKGYDGIFLGKKALELEIEFTSSEEIPKQVTDEDDILVFYFEKEEINRIKELIMSMNIQILTARNPYWNENGIYFKDPDGFAIVVAQARS